MSSVNFNQILEKKNIIQILNLRFENENEFSN